MEVQACMGDNIEIDLKEVGWEGVDQIHLVQDGDQQQAVMNMVMKIWASWNVQHFSTLSF